MPGEPKWIEVRDAIVARIGSGELAIGDRIDPLPDLARCYDVDRNTARRATAYLTEIGVLRTRIGDGTYVEAMPPVVLPDPERRPTLEERVAELERWRAEHERGHRG